MNDSFQYNRIKDGAGAPKRSKRDRVHIKDKNSYHDFDNPSGGRRNSNRNHGSDFSDESSDEEDSKFTYRTNNADDSDSDLENNDEKRSRPRIVDGRKSKSSPARKRNRNDRNSKIKFEDKRSKNRKNDHGSRGKGGTNEKDESRNMKKQEVCKYYLAQTCLKGLFKNIFIYFIIRVNARKITGAQKNAKNHKIRLRII